MEIHFKESPVLQMWANRLIFAIIAFALMGFALQRTMVSDNSASTRIGMYLLATLCLIGIILTGKNYSHLHLHSLAESFHHIRPLHLADWFHVSSSALGAFVCFSLHKYFNFSVVISAAMVGILASFIPKLFSQSTLAKRIPFTLYCGAFVGMSAENILPHALWIMAAGGLAGFLFVWAKNVFVGVGGRLGTLAFISVSIIHNLISWIR